jgi:osmoprotectant transport system ATP-binding protein
MVPAMMTAIAVEHVTKRHGAVAAVDDLSFEVASGEFFVLIGESGCGKTTTLHLLNRLSEPGEGHVLVDGEDVMARDPVALRRRIGFVFQEVGLFPHLTVAENVAITPRLLGWKEAEIAARVDELLELVRLDPRKYRTRLPRELSGGQRQRVGVARALAARPRIMLMDEPFAALDPINRDELAADYKDIHQRLALTTVMVTHDMTEAFLLADRVAVMRAGKIVQLATPQDLLASPADDFIRELIETPRRRAKALAEAMRA